MTNLLVVLLVRCDDGYTVCHLEFAFVLPSVSIYGSWSRSRSQSLCIGKLITLIMSKCALLDLFKFCCQILSLLGIGSMLYCIRRVSWEAGHLHHLVPPTWVAISVLRPIPTGACSMHGTPGPLLYQHTSHYWWMQSPGHTSRSHHMHYVCMAYWSVPIHVCHLPYHSL